MTIKSDRGGAPGGGMGRRQSSSRNRGGGVGGGGGSDWDRGDQMPRDVNRGGRGGVGGRGGDMGGGPNDWQRGKNVSFLFFEFVSPFRGPPAAAKLYLRLCFPSPHFVVTYILSIFG